MSGPQIRIGTSGWNYWHWRGLFYPEDLARSQWLAHYQRTFDTVELNASFYRYSRPSTYARWREASPPGFLWAVKAHREITHFTRLAQREPLDKFLRSVTGLGDSLGVILFQLPPSLKFDVKLAARFFAWLSQGRCYAIEPRHKTWLEEAPLRLLEKHRVALCIADSGRFPSAEALTAEFTYLRFHGREQLYASRYPRAAIAAWARKLAAWNRPAFVYFNNDFHGYAVENAMEMKQELAKLAGSKPRGKPAAAGKRA